MRARGNNVHSCNLEECLKFAIDIIHVGPIKTKFRKVLPVLTFIIHCILCDVHVMGRIMHVYLWDGTEIEHSLVLDPGHVLENIWNMLQSVSDKQI